MPVVPFSPVPPQQPKSVDFTPAQEPWVLMAAAQMDADGRLLDPESDPTPETPSNG